MFYQGEGFYLGVQNLFESGNGRYKVLSLIFVGFPLLTSLSGNVITLEVFSFDLAKMRAEGRKREP